MQSIDIWWILRRGGDLILFAHILQSHPTWQGCSLRLFAVVHPNDDIEETKGHLEELLGVLRVDVREIHVVPINIYHLRMETEDYHSLTEHNVDILVCILLVLTDNACRSSWRDIKPKTRVFIGQQCSLIGDH